MAFEPAQKSGPAPSQPTSQKSEPVLKSEHAPKTVKMKYVANFQGTQKTVQLPIPLIANSQKLDQQLTFTREAGNHGPAYCEVPMEWAGKLLAVGGSFQPADKLSTEIQGQIDAEREATDARMKKFSEENTVSEP